MSTVLFRQRVVAALQQAQADWTGAAFDCEFENRAQINPETQTRPFVCLDIVYLDGEQKDLSNQPLVAVYGQVYFSIAVKQNEGTMFAESLRDFLSLYLELKDWTEGTTGPAKPQKDKPVNGWVYFPVLFNFTVYRHTTM